MDNTWRRAKANETWRWMCSGWRGTGEGIAVRVACHRIVYLYRMISGQERIIRLRVCECERLSVPPDQRCASYRVRVLETKCSAWSKMNIRRGSSSGRSRQLLQVAGSYKIIRFGSQDERRERHQELSGKKTSVRIC
jgi:hypothetical protein